MIHQRKGRLKKSVLVVVTGLLALPVSALASPNYPEVGMEVAQASGSGPSCALPCTTCHLNNNGGTGTASKPFGQKFFLVGQFVYKSAAQLSDGEARVLFELMRDGTHPNVPPQAINVVRGMPTDVDEDGVSDFTELANGINPNRDPPDAELCEITYGCGARVEPRGEVSSGLSVVSSAAVVFALAASLRWARRRGTPQR